MVSIQEFRELKQRYKDAVSKYEQNPTAENEHAMASLKEAIALVVVIIVVAYMSPIALTAINTANTSGWSASQIALWGLLGVLFIIAIYYMLFD